MIQLDLFIVKICRELEAAFNKNILTFSDAKQLSLLMAEKKIFISPHTIARLFGIIKPYRKPYVETLNNLAKFLDYSDWNDYVVSQTILHSDLDFFLTETYDGFSISVLEMALIARDYDEVGRIIEKYEGVEINTTFYASSNLIGYYLKSNNYDKKLLEVLAQSKQGHSLFYECFVDEDNPNNYFSEALVNYYLPKIDNPYKKLFVYTYLIGQSIYKENKLNEYHTNFLELISILNHEECHFHVASRWFECLFIIDGVNGKLEETYQKKLDAVLLFCKDKEAKHWYLFRAIKVMLHFGFVKEVMTHKDINILVNESINNKNTSFKTVSLYGIQLYWLYREKLITKNKIFNPFRIHDVYFHSDNNEKLAIEFAIAHLFSTGKNKEFLNQNLQNFCKANGKRWVLNLIKG